MTATILISVSARGQVLFCCRCWFWTDGAMEHHCRHCGAVFDSTWFIDAMGRVSWAKKESVA